MTQMLELAVPFHLSVIVPLLEQLYLFCNLVHSGMMVLIQLLNVRIMLSKYTEGAYDDDR